MYFFQFFLFFFFIYIFIHLKYLLSVFHVQFETDKVLGDGYLIIF